MGYEPQNDTDHQFTKPKHRFIADAYAKRMDEMISISLDDSRIDPAGLNFDMNHLDSITSDAMGATLTQYTNYLSNIIHRRNAMTTQTRIDFNDPNCVTAATTATAASAIVSTGCVDNNNSEISVSVRHFSVESRRNSMDSQVSQVSVKMSEIKARLESRKQKRRNKNSIVKAKKRPRNQNVFGRSHPRTSYRSNQANGNKYEYRENDDSMGDRFSEVNSTNLMALSQPSPALLPIERFSARTTADINDLNHQLNHQNHRDGNLLASDEDEMHRPNEQMPSDDRLSTASTADSVDGIDDVKSASVDQMVRTFLQTNTGNHIEMFNPSMSGLNGYKKFNGNDMANGKCQKYTQMANGTAPPLPSTQSIICKMSNCDVGTQANDYEIVRYDAHGRQIHDDHVQQSTMIDDGCATETHQLLPNRKREPAPPPLIIRKENLSGKHLSESEKMEQLKRLLLPSN